MADGATHAARNAQAATVVTVIALAGAVVVHPAMAGLALGAIFATIVTPDRDHHAQTREENQAIRRWGVFGWLWNVYWLPYERMNPHRGTSHRWPDGTLDRFVYGLWPLLLASLFLPVPWGWWAAFWWMVFCGQSVVDVFHLSLDGI